MSHDYHDALPGFDPEQILYDGCAECEARSRRTDRGISSLDSANFARAMRRAQTWVASGLPNISEAELPLLTVLSAVQAQTTQARWAGLVS